MCDISFITKADDDELRGLLKDFPEVEYLIERINGLEAVLARLLRERRKDYITAINLFYEEVGQTMGFAFSMGLPGVLASTTMAPAVSLALMPHLQEVASHIASTTMARIDKDVVFQAMSPSRIRFMQAYSDELGRVLDQNTANKVTQVIASTLEQRGSVHDVIQALKDEPDFDRARARRIAITETLTAASVGDDEAYRQSPAVTGVEWLHSGGRKNKPRASHVALSGTQKGLNEFFDVEGELARYPRDTSLSAKQRINCHCTTTPAVDPNILGLSAEEKNAIRQGVIAQFE
ncbi:phage minor head protein [uncultured Exiguobacterium sp.]|uniref:phage minor head protein n=1 Tax=uncultured Exiguobacterium sp. TaxID=202669 RepID=UPI0025D98D32|nr:phage minor head protein [uncultured Exiguobacterium sp.]